MRFISRRAQPIFAVLTMVLAQAQAGAAGSPLEAAIVPGADVLLKIDFKSARKAPIYAALKAAEEQKKEGGAADGLSKAAKDLEQKLGLKEEDIESILVSADLDNIKAAGGSAANPLANSLGLVGVRVSQNVTLEQIKAAFSSVSEKGENTKEVKTSSLKIAGHQALKVLSDKEGDPSILISVYEGKTIFMGINEASLSGALTRSEGKNAPIDAALTKVMDSIPATSQVKLSFVVPAALRQTLQALGGAGGEQAQQGPAAMLSGFSDLRSIALSMDLGEKMSLNLSGDMGSAEAAQGLNMLLSFLKPQLMAGLAEKAGKTPQEIPGNALVTSLQGQVLRIALLLDKELIGALK